jgi:lysozyme family protein
VLDFDACLKFVLAMEGGVVNLKDDSGGLTAYGITQATYHSYLTERGRPLRSVREMKADERNEIYRRVWSSAGCPYYVGPIAASVFDFAVNSGAGRAVRYLQKALWVTEDGQPGAETYKAAMGFDPDMIVWAHLCLRREYLKSLDKDRRATGKVSYLNGWLNRVEALRKFIFTESGERPEGRIA